MKQPVFTGAGAAIVTPMNSDFSVNYAALEQLLEEMIQGGADAVIPCGTTGEASTLTEEEYARVIAFVVEKVNRRIPVVAGAGSNSTAHAVARSKLAANLGADALLHVTPYYNKASQEGLVRHFTAVADAVSLPVILYSVPGRTGVTIAPETCQKLAQHPNIAGIKEASGNLSAIARIRALCGDQLPVYSGNDDQIVPIMSLGGVGVISVLANVLPAQTHRLCRYCLDGDYPRAARMQLDLLGLCGALFADVNPIPVKEALNLLGKNAGPCRLPLCSTSQAVREQLTRELHRLELLP